MYQRRLHRRASGLDGHDAIMNVVDSVGNELTYSTTPTITALGAASYSYRMSGVTCLPRSIVSDCGPQFERSSPRAILTPGHHTIRNHSVPPQADGQTERVTKNWNSTSKSFSMGARMTG